MSERDLAKALRRPGALPPFLTALGIFVALVVLGFLGATLSALSTTVQADIPAEFFLQLWAAQLVGGLAGPLPIALGAFVCFWQIAPIAPNLRLAHVVTRAVLAGLAGTLLLFRSLATFLQVLPVLVLGAVLLWGWLQRHPPTQRVAGTLDEV